jgi:hypothetical protein
MASRRPLALVSGAVSELPTGDTVPGTAVDLSGLAAVYQALDATLTALAGLATGANKFPYSTGTDTFSQADITAAGRALLDDADAAAQIVTLGLAALFQPIDVAPHAFTYASTYAPNWSSGAVHYCTSLTGDITIQEPTNVPSGKVLTVEMIATTSARTVTVDSTILRLAGINPTFVVEAGKMLKLAIENSPVLSDHILIAKGGN